MGGWPGLVGLSHVPRHRHATSARCGSDGLYPDKSHFWLARRRPTHPLAPILGLAIARMVLKGVMKPELIVAAQPAVRWDCCVT